MIKPTASRETNYIYHMLSTAKCGYDNTYGTRYAALHSPEDLAVLKNNELHITVTGGEHCGALYHWLVSVPASLGEVAIPYYACIKQLFQAGEIEAYIRLLRKLSVAGENVTELGSIFTRMNEFPEKF